MPHPDVVVVIGSGLSVDGGWTGGIIVDSPGSGRRGSTGSPAVLHIPPISMPGVL